LGVGNSLVTREKKEISLRGGIRTNQKVGQHREVGKKKILIDSSWARTAVGPNSKRLKVQGAEEEKRTKGILQLKECLGQVGPRETGKDSNRGGDSRGGL